MVDPTNRNKNNVFKLFKCISAIKLVYTNNESKSGHGLLLQGKLHTFFHRDSVGAVIF